MKPPTSLLLLASLILLLSACNPGNSPSPLKFTGCGNIPILAPGEPGTWDEVLVFLPCVVKQNDTFHLFYTGMNKSGVMAIGLATSPDGFHFTKYGGNPVFTHSDKGFDAYKVSWSVVLKMSSGWVMYYTGNEIVQYGPGPFIGRATATEPTGPWIRSETPVLTHGSGGEWDSEFIIPCSILTLEDSTYMMYYSGGAEFAIQNDFYTGMATSEDGISWKKFNDPATNEHPFAESDPVLMTGGFKDWDGMIAWGGPVFKVPGGFEMYYAGGTRPGQSIAEDQTGGFGYATSPDGIHWKKYRRNPVFTIKSDPISSIVTSGGVECPWLLFQDTTCFLYYDYGTVFGKIGMATAKVR